MNTDTLGLDIQTKIPKVFIRGQTLEFLMELPYDIPADYFNNMTEDPATSTSTTLASELRQVQNAGTSGLIAPLTVTWETGTKLRFHADNTGNWPLGPAEFDVVFVRTTIDLDSGQPTAVRWFRSLPVRITIADGVTA